MPKGVYKKSEEHMRKFLLSAKLGIRHSGKKHFAWKGDQVGYLALHVWVTRWKGSPNLCENCGITTAKRYDWANISGKYKRDLNDYKRLCRHCHRVFDKKTKLSEKNVLEILKLWEKKELGQKAIAKKFNVCQQMVSCLVTKKRWSHLTNKINETEEHEVTKLSKSRSE